MPRKTTARDVSTDRRRKLSELQREAYWNDLSEMAIDGKIDEGIASKYMGKMERKGENLTRGQAENYRRRAIRKGLTPMGTAPLSRQPMTPAVLPEPRKEWKT